MHIKNYAYNFLLTLKSFGKYPDAQFSAIHRFNCMFIKANNENITIM